MTYRNVLRILPVLLLGLAACTRDPKAKAQVYLEKGNKFYDRAKFKEASLMYRNALKQDRRFGEAYYRLGLTDLKLSDYGGAYRAFIDAVDLEPKNLDAKSQLGKLYLMAAVQSGNDRNRLAEAEKNARELAANLLKQDPKSYDGHLLLGQLALLDRDVDAAIPEFEAANAAKPLQADVVLPYVQALAVKNRFPEAEKLAYQLIDKNKNDGAAYDVLYSEYARLNRLDDAEKILKLKIANNPKSSTDVLQLASFYLATKKQDQADAVFKNLADDKQYPDGHLLAGDYFLFRLKQYDRARAEYEAGMKAFPKDKVLYQKRLVEVDASSGNVDAANQLLAAILKDNSKDNEAVAMRAALALNTGNRDQINSATNDLQSLVTKTPDNYVLRYNLARALRAKGDIPAAILQLETAYKLRPDFIKARELLATLYLSNRETTKALKTADELIAVNPGDVQAHLVRSGALLTTGDREQAHKELDFIVKNFPQNIEARYQVGYLDFVEKDYKTAADVFGSLAKDYPKDYRGLAGLTEALVAEGRMSDALAAVQQAIATEPDNINLHVLQANLDVRSRNFDGAIAVFQGLLKKTPNDPTLLYRTAETYRLKGDLNSAAQYLRSANQAAPTSTQPLLALAQIMEGTGRADQAAPLYEQVLKIESNNPIALNNLAFMKANNGTDLEEALSMAQRARQQAPNSDEIADTLGWIYIKKNLSEQAVRLFQELVSKEPGNSTFHYHYAMALSAKGDKSATRRELELALHDNPSKPQEAEIRQMLNKL